MQKYILIRNYVANDDGDLQVRDSAQFLLLPVRPELVIGRSPETTPSQQRYTVMGWGDMNRAVSRNHCTLTLSDGVVLISDGDGRQRSRWGTYWGRQRLDIGSVEMLPEDEEHTIIAIPPHRLTAMVSSDRILLDLPQDETVKTSIRDSLLEVRVEELERKVEELERAIAGLQRCQKREY